VLLQLIVVFIVGGSTYEEARAVAELNAQSDRNEGWSAGIRIVLGGTGVLNSTSFMRDLMAFMALN
jgi:vacuolar protein sorting-associated protein 45